MKAFYGPAENGTFFYVIGHRKVVHRYANARGSDLTGWTWDCLIRIPNTRNQWAIVGIESRRKKNGRAAYRRRVVGFIPEPGETTWMDDEYCAEETNAPHILYDATLHTCYAQGRRNSDVKRLGLDEAEVANSNSTDDVDSS
jgi:hypothetical protein